MKTNSQKYLRLNHGSLQTTVRIKVEEYKEHEAYDHKLHMYSLFRMLIVSAPTCLYEEQEVGRD